MIKQPKKLHTKYFLQEIFTKFHIFEDFLHNDETFPGSRDSGILKQIFSTHNFLAPKIA